MGEELLSRNHARFSFGIGFKYIERLCLNIDTVSMRSGGGNKKTP